MTLQKQNPWKLLSIGLLGVIAIGLFVPVDAAAPNKEIEATEVDCENPCIDETELTFTVATQEAFDILDGTVAGLIVDLATEATARADADTALQTQIDEIVDQSCSPGDVVTGIAADGTVQCAADNDTSYTAGTGLNLSGTTFSVDTSVMQRRVSGECPAGSSVRSISSTGTVTCEPDTDTNTTYSAGNGLTLSGTTFSADTSVIQNRITGTCAVGQYIREIAADGTVTCQPDDAGTPLSTYWGSAVDTLVSEGTSSGPILAPCDDIADLAIGRVLLSTLPIPREPLAIIQDGQPSNNGYNWMVDVKNIGSGDETVRIIPICIDRSP